MGQCLTSVPGDPGKLSALAERMTYELQRRSRQVMHNKRRTRKPSVNSNLFEMDDGSVHTLRAQFNAAKVEHDQQVGKAILRAFLVHLHPELKRLFLADKHTVTRLASKNVTLAVNGQHPANSLTPDQSPAKAKSAGSSTASEQHSLSSAHSHTDWDAEDTSYLEIIGMKLDSFLIKLIDCIENDPVEAKRHCHTLGRMHFYKSVQFNHEYFDAFKQATLYVILGTPLGTPVSDVSNEPWQKMMDYLVAQIMHGILHESVTKQNLEQSAVYATQNERRSSHKVSVGSASEGATNGQPESKHSLSLLSLDMYSIDRRYSQKSNTSGNRNDKMPRPSPGSRRAALGTDNYRLSVTEKILLQRLWKNTADKMFGQAILVDLFTEKPDLTKYFGMNESELANLADSVTVKVHGFRLYGHLENVIHLIRHDNYLRATSVCERVGQIHFHRGVHFTADNWLVFKRNIIKNLLEPLVNDHERLQAEVMMEKVMRFVTNNIKRGYLDAAITCANEPPPQDALTIPQIARKHTTPANF